jgi:DinB superfamily
MTIDWTFQLYEQLDWQWREHMRPRWDGLTDEEYFWEPVPGMWNVRPRGTAKAETAFGSGDFTCDYAWPEPDPAIDYQTYDYPGDAATALSRLDAAYAAWATGVRTLDPEGLGRPIGEAEGPFAAEPMAQLILHINREALHHGAEISLLRDLYRWKI